MRTLIIYYSKYGFTKECAEYLKNNIKGEVKLANIVDGDDFELSYYDNIIIGSAIYVGMVNSKIKDFCNKNLEHLINTKTSVFICSGFDENFDTYMSQNFDENLLKNLFFKKHFGGELRVNDMSFIDKMITKMVSKSSKDDKKPVILKNNLDEFVSYINK